MDNDILFRNRIRAIRTEKGISQDKLANMVGTTRQTIIAIEKNQFNPSAKLAFFLCIALETKFEDLFYVE
ncbi:MAG: helix-turn-helix transcriptional regulator [Clostridia bacterium]|nr:helix-turn-helix transcriptional regulator [Clostridia bacterium]